jgi:pyruvate dehydrogenase E1 component alpha subunit
MIEEWRKKDPIDRLERILMADHLLTGESKKRIEEGIRAEVEEAVAFATGSPYPPGEDAGKGVYAP